MAELQVRCVGKLTLKHVLANMQAGFIDFRILWVFCLSLLAVVVDFIGSRNGWVLTDTKT